jgi:diguanylate cyclase (GGDEF)-like protein
MVRANVIIKGGDAPAAGFEKSESKNNSLPLRDRRSGDRRKNDAASSHGPLDSIAAAGHEAQVLYQLNQTLGTSLSMEETLSAMEEQLKLLISYDCFALYLVDGDNLVPVHASGVDKKLFKNLVVPVGHGVSGWVTESRLPIINGNPSVEFGILNPKVDSSLLSTIAIPLEKAHVGKEGNVFGVLALFSTQMDAFSHDHLRVLQAIIERGARSIENSLNYRRMEREANTDHLTGLLNSRGFMLKAEEKIENCETSLALIACDLDDFKLVNDTEGHPAGDQLLRAVADVFVGICGHDAAVARLGGDEFAAILIGLGRRKVDDLLGQLVLAIEGAASQILPDLQISASLGAAILGEDGTTLGQLASLADRRMYAMKRADDPTRRILYMAKAAS